MIQNKNLILRAVEPSDLDLLYEWENNMQLWRVSNTLTPFSKYQLKQFIENSSLDIYQTRQLRLMIDVKTQKTVETAGIIDLFDFDPYHCRAGVGIMIHGKYRKKGIATNAMKLFVNYVASELGIHNLYCNIQTENKASIKLFTSLGFELTGIKKEWLKKQNGYEDELMYQLIIGNS